MKLSELTDVLQNWCHKGFSLSDVIIKHNSDNFEPKDISVILNNAQKVEAPKS